MIILTILGFTAYCIIIFFTGVVWMDRAKKEGSYSTHLTSPVMGALMIEIALGIIVLIISNFGL